MAAEAVAAEAVAVATVGVAVGIVAVATLKVAAAMPAVKELGRAEDSAVAGQDSILDSVAG